jgi:Mrp family chromosome partitioning ATPase
MLRGDPVKFKQTMMDENFTSPPEPTRLRSVPSSPVLEPPAAAPSPAAAPLPAEPVVFQQDGAGKTTLMRWTDTEAIVPVRRSPSYVLEEAEIPSSVDQRLVMLYGHASEQARAYRLLRHRLLHESDPRVIAVTSAEPGEGKTTCAANLALALADETMARVLLVEANLRRPALGEVFGFEPADSFVRRLIEQRDASPPYAVAAIRGTRLHIAALPSGRARELKLDRLLLDAALHDLRASYDYIVIDAAAVLESADADVAGECAEGVVLVARAQSSHRGAMEEALAQLHPTRILGTVVLDT